MATVSQRMLPPIVKTEISIHCYSKLHLSIFFCQLCLDSRPYLQHHFDCSSYSTILTTLFSCWKTIEHSSHPPPREKKYSTLKEGLREGEKKRKGKERCKSGLQQEAKAYTLNFFQTVQLLLSYWCRQMGGFGLLTAFGVPLQSHHTENIW